MQNICKALILTYLGLYDIWVSAQAVVVLEQPGFLLDEQAQANVLMRHGITLSDFMYPMPSGKEVYRFGSFSDESQTGTEPSLHASGKLTPSMHDIAYSDAHLIYHGNETRTAGYRSIGRLYRYSNNAYSSWCSGSLIAPRIVLTAASCVYSNGTWMFSQMKFVPALLPDGSQPYSYGVVTQVLYWNPWVEEGDYDNDIAILYLDRPVGAIVGTSAYSASFDEDDYFDWPYFHYGYPNAFGSSLYTLSTHILNPLFGSAVDTYQVETYFQDTASNISYSVTGMKGAGLAFLDCTTYNNAYYCTGVQPKFLNAVLSRWQSYTDQYGSNGCSNQNGCYEWYGNSTRITSGKAEDIAEYTLTSIPVSYDYWPLYIHASPAGSSDPIATASTSVTWVRGNTYEACFLIHNNSSKNASSVAITENFYLSTDKYIQTNDVFLKKLSGSLSINSLQTKRYCSNFSVPISQAPGIYYLGAIFSINGDYATYNNTTSTRDILKVTVQ